MIETRQLSKRYGRRRGLSHLDLTVTAGEVFGFLGPNGAGKTTTIRMLLGLLRPTAGSATVFGRDCWRDARHIKAEVGYVPGDLRLYPWLRPRDALELFGRIRKQDLSAAGAALLERFELDPQVKVRKMSKGMRQKLGLVLALACDPRLLILDEPTTALDPLMQERLYEHLRERSRRGRTVFFSSHTLSEVEQLCDRVMILREGEVVADQSLDHLREQAGREVTIHWRPGAEVDPPPPALLEIRLREDHLWRCTLSGSTAELIQWLSSRPVDDVHIGQPNLESLFRRYYQHGEDSA